MDIESSQLNEEEIICQVLSGRVQMYEILVRKYWKLAVATALSKCHNPASAEDIAQESFIRSFHYLPTLRNRQRFAGWLLTIIRQQHIAHLRKEAQRQKIESVEQYRQNFLAASNPGLSDRQIRFVHGAIANLPEKFQTVILMRFVGGLSIEQIAQQLEQKHSTVRVWLHRAYNTLRMELAPIIEEVQL